MQRNKHFTLLQSEIKKDILNNKVPLQADSDWLSIGAVLLFNDSDCILTKRKGLQNVFKEILKDCDSMGLHC